MARRDRTLGLTGRQRYALHLLERYAGTDDGWGLVTSGRTEPCDGLAWINWRTAAGLEERGLVVIDRSMGRDEWRLRAAKRHQETTPTPSATGLRGATCHQDATRKGTQGV